MGTIVVPEEIKRILHLFIGCPQCGRFAIDKRYKTDIKHTPTHIYRASMTSVTLECRVCDLRFCLTWNHLVKFLCKEFDTTAKKLTGNQEEDDTYLRWLTAIDKNIKLLDSTFDTFYSKRNTPVG